MSIFEPIPRESRVDEDTHEFDETAWDDDSAPTGGSHHGIVYGNWADMIIGLWGEAMEVTVDPYTQKLSGMIEIATFQMGDIVIRHGESFVKSHGATLS